MPNIWTQFQGLLPKSKQLIGTITSVDEAAKTCTIELLSGNSIVVKGTGTVDNKYLIKDGVIVSEMPALTVYNETIS